MAIVAWRHEYDVSSYALPPAWRVVVSLLPLLVVIPSPLLPRWIHDEQREHVARHAAYALAFTVAAAASVKWQEAILPALRAEAPWTEADADAWVWPLIAYPGIGTATLWWFSLAPVLAPRRQENVPDPIHARYPAYPPQGDVAVLPLTLVSIATFANAVPDEAFQFSRSIIFYVPIIVAWATLMFVAYNGFATSRTTTLHEPGFAFLALSGLVIGTAHLTLLETRAPSVLFQCFPVIAAVLCQVTPRSHLAPKLRPGHVPGTVVVSGGLGALLGYALSMRFPVPLAYASAVYGSVAATLVTRRLAGHRWIVPATLYASLLTASLLLGVTSAAAVLRLQDAAAIFAGYLAVFGLVARLAPAVYEPSPDHLRVPLDANATPQLHAPWWAPSKLLARLPCALSGSIYDADGSASVRHLLARVGPPHPQCPATFSGVWWMEGNTFPMDLISVQHATWGTTDSTTDSRTATVWNRRGVTRRTTLGGWILHAVSWTSQPRITVVDSRWIRTDGWLVPILRLCAHTYWLYRLSDDVMLRLVYNSQGRIVWQYRMLRVAKGDGTLVRAHLAAFARACSGAQYLVA